MASAIAPGFIAGLIIGGLGSRIAMRVMALTSTDTVQGTETEFGATVGQISLGGSIFLLLAGGAIGVLGALMFLALRRWLPGKGWVRGLLFGSSLVAIFGRVIIDSDNEDFVILDPPELAIGMFGTIFVIYGLLFVLLYEGLGPIIMAARTRWVPVALVLALFIPLLLTGVFGLFLAGAVLVGFAVNGSERFMRLWSQPLVGVAGYVILSFLIVFGATEVAGSIIEIL